VLVGDQDDEVRAGLGGVGLPLGVLALVRLLDLVDANVPLLCRLLESR